MKKTQIFALLILSTFFGAIYTLKNYNKNTISGAPPFGETEEDLPMTSNYNFWENWKRPEGRPKVAVQAGHWKNNELPEELARLRGNGGASGGGKAEWEVNLLIAREVKEILEGKDIEVEILPATIPKSYWADVFVAIHADGSEDSRKSGFKIAPPWRDITRKADKLSRFIEENYQIHTKLAKDENITRNMRGYYAFSWWRFKHALHPMTTAVIAETGFLTNPKDRKLLLDNPRTAARGIAEGIIGYFGSEGMMDK